MGGGIIKVHGSVLSTSTMKVVAALYEKGLEFEFIKVDLRSGEHKKEPFLSLNPFGQIPVFEDGDLKLFESRAITTYIAHKYGEKGNQLISSSTHNNEEEMGIIGVWSEVEAHQYYPVTAKLVWELAFKPLFGLPIDDAVVEEYEEKLGKVLDVYEARLRESKYLGGESFSIADLYHLPSLTYMMSTSPKRLYDSRPHVSAWVKDITARPAWCKVLDFQNKHK